MPLHDRRVEHAGQDDEVALRPRGTVEHHPLARAVGSPQEPAREAVGEATGVLERLVHRPARDVELRSGCPRRRIRLGFDDRAAARDAFFVDRRPERLIDLSHQELAECFVSVRPQAAFVELLGESPQARGWCLRHRHDGRGSPAASVR